MGLIFEFVFLVRIRLNAQFKNYVARVAHEDGLVETLIQYPVLMLLYEEVQILYNTYGDDWVCQSIAYANT